MQRINFTVYMRYAALLPWSVGDFHLHVDCSFFSPASSAIFRCEGPAALRQISVKPAFLADHIGVPFVQPCILIANLIVVRPDGFQRTLLRHSTYEADKLVLHQVPLSGLSFTSMPTNLFRTYRSVAYPLRCHFRRLASESGSISSAVKAPTGNMGLSWSSRTNDGSDVTTPEWTSIDSKPVDKLYEPIAVSTRLPPKTISRIRSQRKTYTWSVEFEMDVAYLQRRFKLCTVPTTLSDGVERILVTPDMIRAMVEDNQVRIDEMCNICALHITLQGDEEQEMSICLVVDVSRDGGMETEAMSNLTRRIYGYTNQEPQDQVIR